MLTTGQIPTPALLLDLDAFHANLQQMAAHAKTFGKALRPHAKAHKCVQISKLQLAAGSSGICVATVSEAELMANAGIADLLLTSPIADPYNMARIVKTGAMVVVDHVQQVDWYNEAAHNANRTLDVLIDLDGGDHRTGARPDGQALAVAEAVDRATHLNLRGTQAYSVLGSHANTREERRLVSEKGFELAAETRGSMSRKGLCTDILTGGSTGTWDIDTGILAVTELQAGSYALMDLAYRRLEVRFRRALTVLTTVISANHDAFVTVDGGFKAFSTDRPFGPEAIDQPGSTYRWGGDEFGYFEGFSTKPRLGDRIEFLHPHCDPTVNLYDRIYACRGENVEDVWPVMDRMR